MTPESGLTTSDTRVDLYTLGLTLYYAATGVHPFSGARLSELLRRQIHQSIPDPAPLAPDVPSRYWKILSKCLEFQREDRYQTARYLLVDLARVIDDFLMIAQDSHVWRSPT